MSGFVGADVEQLNDLAHKLELESRRLAEISGSSSAAIMIAQWTGAKIDRLRGEWNRQTKPAMVQSANELQRLAQSLRKQAEEQLSASSALGGVRRRALHAAPKDVRDLIHGTKEMGRRDLFRYEEVVGDDGVIRVIVTIPGTKGDITDGAHYGQRGGWGSNPGIWLDQNSDVKDAILVGIRERMKDHPDAEVMIVGYSQGGMLAQSIADDEEFKVKEVVTVGSPHIILNNNLGGANIVAFQHDSDPVIKLTGVPELIRNEATGNGVVRYFLENLMGVEPENRGNTAVVFHGGGFALNPHDITTGDYDRLADQYQESTDPHVEEARERQSRFMHGNVVMDEKVQ